MNYTGGLRRGILTLSSMIFLFFSCSRNQGGEASLVSGEEEMQASFSPPATSPDPEEFPEKSVVHAVDEEFRMQDGLIREKGDFWIGFPGKPGSTAYLKLGVDTKVSVLNVVDGYYKVRYLNLTGFVEKSIVELRKASVAGPDETGIASSERTGAAAPEDPAGHREDEHSLPAATPCAGLIDEDIFPGVSCDTYRAKVKEKVNTLENYITRIIDKSELNREKSIDLACRLFVNEHAQVYTSGLDEPARSRPVRKYLNSLMALSYEKVTIEWTNIQYISELRKGPDGRYFGFVHIEQKFQGFSDGRLVYGDITEKKISIILEAYDVVDARGESGTRWDIFLSDIGVEQTLNL